jgi:hypothetical protein
MNTSIETRWFLPESDTGAALLKSFLTRQHKDIDESKWDREDFYKPTPHNYFGFKIREGKAEIKTILHDYGCISFGQSKGFVQLWDKYSFDLQKNPVEFPIADAEQIKDKESYQLINVNEHRWWRIAKSRALLKYELDPTGGFNVTSEKFVEKGINMEIGKIKATNSSLPDNCENFSIYWTLAFESFGKFDDQLTLMENFITALFNTELPGVFTESRSASYPSFLQKQQF